MRTPAELDELLRRLRTARGGPDPFGYALKLILAHFAAESGTVHVLADGLLHLRAHSEGMPPPVLDVIRTIPIGKGMAGLAAERRAPVTACNLQTDASGDVRPGARATGLKGSIVVPMMRAGEPVGTLGIANRDERTFAEAEVDALLALAAELARWL